MPREIRLELLALVRQVCDQAHDEGRELTDSRARAAAQLTAAMIWYRVSRIAAADYGLEVPPREPGT